MVTVPTKQYRIEMTVETNASTQTVFDIIAYQLRQLPDTQYDIKLVGYYDYTG